MSEGTGQLDPRQLATYRDESDIQDRQSHGSGKYRRDGSPSPSVPPSVAGASVPASGRPSTGASFELLGDGDEEDGYEEYDEDDGAEFQHADFVLQQLATMGDNNGAADAAHVPGEDLQDPPNTRNPPGGVMIGAEQRDNMTYGDDGYVYGTAQSVSLAGHGVFQDGTAGEGVDVTQISEQIQSSNTKMVLRQQEELLPHTSELPAVYAPQRGEYRVIPQQQGTYQGLPEQQFPQRRRDLSPIPPPPLVGEPHTPRGGEVASPHAGGSAHARLQ